MGELGPEGVMAEPEPAPRPEQKQRVLVPAWIPPQLSLEGASREAALKKGERLQAAREESRLIQSEEIGGDTWQRLLKEVPAVNAVGEQMAQIDSTFSENLSDEELRERKASRELISRVLEMVLRGRDSQDGRPKTEIIHTTQDSQGPSDRSREILREVMGVDFNQAQEIRAQTGTEPGRYEISTSIPGLVYRANSYGEIGAPGSDIPFEDFRYTPEK